MPISADSASHHRRRALAHLLDALVPPEELLSDEEGGRTRRTPWHQDTSYLPITGQKLAVLWISFDPVAKEAALEFVRGSHRGPLHDGSRFDIVSFPVEPGDVVAFHPSMLHGGAATPPGGRRRTLTLRFFGDDVRYAPRAGFSGILPDEPTTYFEELPACLRAGDPFRHSGFPKVRPH